MVCENSFNPVTHMGIYRAAKHKGVHCATHDAMHVIPTGPWKDFLSKVRSSDLTTDEKNKFLHLGASPHAVRAYYASEIEATSFWEKHAVPLLNSQQVFIQEFEQTIVSNSAHVETTIPLSKLRTILVDSQRLFVQAETLDAFVKDLFFKHSFTGLINMVPSIVYTHVETMLTEIADTYTEALLVEFADTTDMDLAIIFVNSVCQMNYSDETLLQTIDPETHIVLKCAKCEKIHVVGKDSWLGYMKRRKTAKMSAIQKSEVTKHLTVINCKDYCLELLKSYPLWPNIQLQLEEMKALVSEMKHQKAYPNPERRNEIINLLNEHMTNSPIPTEAPNLVRVLAGKQERSLLTEVLLLLKQEKQGDSANLGIRREHGNYYTPQPDSEFLIPSHEFPTEMFEEFWVCGRKQSYRTYEEANLSRIVNDWLGICEIYSCNYCEGFHFGKPSRYEHSEDDYENQGRLWYMSDPRRANAFVKRRLGKQAITVQ